MKIRSRLLISFLTITVLPILLLYLSFHALNKYQVASFQRTYSLQEQVDLLSGNSPKIFNRMTREVQRDISRILSEEPDHFLDEHFLIELNEELEKRYAYLVVRKGQKLIFCGIEELPFGLMEQLPANTGENSKLDGILYMDREGDNLVRQQFFTFGDGEEGVVYIISHLGTLVPEVRAMLFETIASGVLILILTGCLLTGWVYKSFLEPISKLKQATNEIKNGNLDFVLDCDLDTDDDLGKLFQDFEAMRIRLKENAEEKIAIDKENRELISNISHDLKTPITAIKGYVEGIMDGVASSPEKLDRYIRTIYNKANDMDRLINELTFYSKIDSNRIPYNFTKINLDGYFSDCIEEVGLDLDANGIELGYTNQVDTDVEIIADPEQLKRVINNIISNSVKYLDKTKGVINIRIKDEGDFVEIDIEDNGKGISQKDLPNIFDRFYRTDSSRNSSKGGSGIGLSIVKKIIQDHGGQIWATSKEGIGTEIHFVLRKYQEVIQNI